MAWWGRKSKDDEQREKIEASQKILLEAAISTADMAQFVTTRLKERLEDAIHQFETTASIMADALLMCDVTGQIKACNPVASKIFGYDSSEIMKKLSFDLFKHQGNAITNPDELWAFLSPEVVHDTFDLSGIRANGECFPIEVTMTRLGRADGSFVMLMLIRDVSDIMALKKEAEDNAKRYRSLFELCFDGILVVQKNKIVAANRQAGTLFGVPAENLLGVLFSKLVNAEYQDKLERLDGASAEPVEADALRSDGTAMTLLLSGAEIVWGADKACLVAVRALVTTYLGARPSN